MAAIDIRPAEGRFHTRMAWLDSRHSFSFGEHYNPDNTHHGLLQVLNDDRVMPGQGFGRHSHRDMEIVTWVLDGALEHQDSAGHHGVIRPGLIQRMSAGTGIQHSEYNASADAEVHFLQMWVLPDTRGVEPGYEQLDVSATLAEPGLHVVAAGGDQPGAVHLNQRDATLSIGRLGPGDEVSTPAGGHVHVFVAAGSARLDGEQLDTGDAARLTEAGDLSLVAGAGGAEVVIWSTA